MVTKAVNKHLICCIQVCLKIPHLSANTFALGMKHLYIISGLGADERVFHKVDFTGYRVAFISWIKPAPKESLKQYASRLSKQIIESRPIIIGISFGGMLAVEIAQLLPVEKVILLATAKTRSELPFYYRLAGRLKLHTLLPASVLKQPNFLSYWLFGVACEEDRKLLAVILKETDSAFLKWAMDAIIKWQNNLIPAASIHIHGDADHVLPIRFVNPDIRIDGGGHLITLTKAAQLSAALREMLG